MTTTEKVAIFESKKSIIEMIVFKTHLNSKIKKYHNCGITLSPKGQVILEVLIRSITDLHSGYGIINDGKDNINRSITDLHSGYGIINDGKDNINRSTIYIS